MTRTANVYLLCIATIVLAIATLLFVQATQHASASAPAGLKTTIATSSPMAVGTTAVGTFATSTCDARIVTTYASPIMLTFNDYNGQTPSGTFGHLQPASTTVVYDSGQYGCGLVKVYSFVAQTITVSESR